MEIFLTILSGVAIFVIGQVFLKLVIEPVHRFRSTISDISYALVYYADIYSNPGVTGEDRETETKQKLRTLSSDLNAATYLIPKYDLVRHLFGLPHRDNIVKAVGLLIGLSNSLRASKFDRGTDNFNRYQQICINLNIYLPKEERPDESGS
ncbi:hypothetical protein [Sulfuriflexus mobilis]|uniref:hypothetical protein n=1 Tax=Sulfuriflexus mobilis TaxID=1811807 RepID=UPI000F822055|nr:hypothetical protein [Sulfuriflexus mobilis]